MRSMTNQKRRTQISDSVRLSELSFYRLCASRFEDIFIRKTDDITIDEDDHARIFSFFFGA